MIKCPNCTGELEFKPTDKQVVCKYCGSKFDRKEFDEKVTMSKENEAVATYSGKTYSCSQCGAELMTFDETAITFCSYCGSQAMIESKMMKQNNPDFIIPFAKSREECIEAYKKVVSRSLFTPNYMKSDVTLEKFRGIYLPYCIYKLENHGSITNKGSKYSHRVGDYQYYNDYSITCDVDASYEGISYDLISKFYDKFSTSIPFDYHKKEEFNPNYLIGYYADTVDVDSSVYDADARGVAQRDASHRLSRIREFSKYGCSSPTVKLNVTDKKVGMFPVYFLAIRDTSNKKINFAVVNGQTGKVAIDLPIDYFKYLIGTLLLSVVLFFILDNFFVILPKAVCVFSAICAVLSLVLSCVQASGLKNRVNHTDDIGFMSKEVNKNSVKNKVGIFRYLYKEIIAIIIPIVALILNFVYDGYYYGASFIALGLVILSFRDLVKEHNMLVSNKLPQLEKRGGDEHE